MTIIANSFVASETSYCPLVWSFSSRTSLAKIEYTYVRSTRLVSEGNTIVRKYCMHRQYCEILLKEIFKTKHGLNPSYMHTVFSIKENPRYNLRSGDTIIRDGIHTTKWGLKSISYMGAQLWESLPKSVKCVPSLNSFLNQIRHLEGLNCKCRLCASFIPNLGSSYNQFYINFLIIFLLLYFFTSRF